MEANEVAVVYIAPLEEKSHQRCSWTSTKKPWSKDGIPVLGKRGKVHTLHRCQKRWPQE